MPLVEREMTAVLPRLRAELREGRHAPGEALSISHLAQRLGFSPTPVREALAHLAGEGLVAERRGQGYFAPGLDAELLAERYDLHQLYLVAALQAPARALGGLAAATMGLPADPTEFLFAELVAAAGDRALAEAHLRLTHQLAAARQAERRLWGDPTDELLGLRRGMTAGDRPGLLAACATYHQRRREAARDLTALVRAGAAKI